MKDKPKLRINLEIGPDDGQSYLELMNIAPKKRARRVRHLLLVGAIAEAMMKRKQGELRIGPHEHDIEQSLQVQTRPQASTRKSVETPAHSSVNKNQPEISSSVGNRKSNTHELGGKYGIDLSFLKNR